MREQRTIHIILVEDDEDVRIGNVQALELAGFTVESFATAEQAHPHIHVGLPAIVLCDVKLPGKSGTSWLHEIRDIDAELPVILVTGHGDIAMAVNAMRDGAYDFIAKLFPSDYLVSVVRRATDRRQLSLQVQQLRDQLDNRQGIEAMLIGRSAQMERVRRSVLSLAATSADIVIYGETGTGKDVVARCLHTHSKRRHANFVPLNCGGLPDALVESELFGHEAGAFTGAIGPRVGKFEFANGGTLFLDEIESMPLPVQTKFLRALQERSIERVGSNKPIAVDCRVVAASKEDLKAMSERTEFRADLYYRLGVAFIELPPLRERREDIPLLFEHFTLSAASRYSRPAPLLSSGFLAELMGHQWPGNVRELRNVADRFVLGILETGMAVKSTAAATSSCSLPEQIEHFERALISDELLRRHGDVTATAKGLGLPKQTLYDKMNRLRVIAEEFRTEPRSKIGTENQSR